MVPRGHPGGRCSPWVSQGGPWDPWGVSPGIPGGPQGPQSGLWSSDQEKVFTFFRTDRNWTDRNRTGPRTGVTYAEQRLLIMDHGSWIIDQRLKIKDQWSSINDQRSSIMDQRSSIKDQRSSIKYQVSSIKYQGSRIKDLGPWTLDLAWMTILDGIPTWDQDHPNLLSKIYHFK